MGVWEYGSMGVWEYGSMGVWELLIFFSHRGTILEYCFGRIQNIKHSHTPILPYSHTFLNLAQ